MQKKQKTLTMGFEYTVFEACSSYDVRIDYFDVSVMIKGHSTWIFYLDDAAECQLAFAGDDTNAAEECFFTLVKDFYGKRFLYDHKIVWELIAYHIFKDKE